LSKSNEHLMEMGQSGTHIINNIRQSTC
jgi:hypothetical protein